MAPFMCKHMGNKLTCLVFRLPASSFSGTRYRLSGVPLELTKKSDMLLLLTIKTNRRCFNAMARQCSCIVLCDQYASAYIHDNQQLATSTRHQAHELQ